jgi:hypothetical protein
MLGKFIVLYVVIFRFLCRSLVGCGGELIAGSAEQWKSHGREQEFMQSFRRETRRKERFGRPGGGWEDNFIMDH